MHPTSRVPLGGELLRTPHFRIAPDLFALGLSTDKGINFQGLHARKDGFMLIILDEAPGVPPSVYNAIEGVRAGGDVRVLALGNPDVPSGPFYDAFTVDRAGWETFTIDAFTSPNFEDEENPGHYLTLEDLLALPEHRIDYAPRPYLITRRFVREKYDEWGPASPLWASKVCGAFPDQSEDSLISLKWLEDAKHREYAPSEHDEWSAGIDVAGPGEAETVLVIRRGPHLEQLIAWADADPRGKVLEALEPYRDFLFTVSVDSVGTGYYFAKHLEDHGWQGRVRYVNVGVPAGNSARYANRKAELYWGLRMRIQTGDIMLGNGDGKADERLLSQLASIKYKPNERGQITIERKVDALKRGVASPDRAEALMLAFAETTPGQSVAVPVHPSRWGVGRTPHAETAELIEPVTSVPTPRSTISVGRSGSRWRR
jgi:phage terminase large subunit